MPTGSHDILLFTVIMHSCFLLPKQAFLHPSPLPPTTGTLPSSLLGAGSSFSKISSGHCRMEPNKFNFLIKFFVEYLKMSLPLKRSLLSHKPEEFNYSLIRVNGKPSADSHRKLIRKNFAVRRSQDCAIRLLV
jgi:hypothetical protein